MDYITLTNRIKEIFNENWLTDSQNNIYKIVLLKYQTHKIVNIFGEVGTGKTFLGWNIAKAMSASYTSNIEDVGLKSIVVLDNWSHKKQDVRNILPIMHLNGIKKVILLTEKEVKDDIVSLELLLTENDKTKFKNTLWKHFDLKFDKEKANHNLHSLIKANIG